MATQGRTRRETNRRHRRRTSTCRRRARRRSRRLPLLCSQVIIVQPSCRRRRCRRLRPPPPPDRRTTTSLSSTPSISIVLPHLPPALTSCPPSRISPFEFSALQPFHDSPSSSIIATIPLISPFPAAFPVPSRVPSAQVRFLSLPPYPENQSPPCRFLFLVKPFPRLRVFPSIRANAPFPTGITSPTST